MFDFNGYILLYNKKGRKFITDELLKCSGQCDENNIKGIGLFRITDELLRNSVQCDENIEVEIGKYI